MARTISVVAVNPILTQWNALDASSAAAAILPCCGSEAWALTLSDRRPFEDEEGLLRAASEVWYSLLTEDWQQAFDSHPRIGERKAQGTATETSLAFSASEQSTAMRSDDAEKQALRERNQRYEERFGRIFILCARGRSAGEILAEIERRLRNSAEEELAETAREQAQITELRLKHWLRSP